LIVTDSVFSMDGDIAPLIDIAELAERHDARLLVDEAHATGAIGPGGRGVVAAAGLEGQVDVIVGTLGKALGSYGAYVCAQESVIQYLVNRARPLIFSTAPAPPAVAGALAALDLLEERPHRVDRLRLAARALSGALASEGFAVAESERHIVPLVLGDERQALALSQAAVERGVFVQAIRPPSVPDGTARLRLSVMSSHTGAELRGAARLLGRIAREQGLDPAGIGPAAGRPGEIEDVGREEMAYGEAVGGRSPFEAEMEWVAGDPRHEESESAAWAGAGPMGPSALFDIERDNAVRRAA
ncbi:MAG: aminotransferase class I/II-fold pyridoxal phosphate-dependent enzyme, partial [Acidobacteriota bacterium]|nr:aminotransferase class I/II-fold pyridoxal phosphate-dependent enzyme [Acidobacteriota bacterium]